MVRPISWLIALLIMLSGMLYNYGLDISAVLENENVIGILIMFVVSASAVETGCRIYEESQKRP